MFSIVLTSPMTNSCGQRWYKVVISASFGGVLTPWEGKKLGVKIFYQEVKLLVHTLLTSHHTSNSDNFRVHNQVFRHFNPKRGIFGGVFTPWEGRKMGAKKNLLENQTTCPYASNKLSYIKFGPFLGALSTFLTL